MAELPLGRPARELAAGLLVAVGTDSYLPDLWRETYATADIVAYDGKPSVKVGREFLLKKRIAAENGRKRQAG